MLLRPFVGIIILQQQHFKWKLAAAWSVVHNWLAPCLHTAQRQCSIMLSIDSIIEKITLLKASVNLDWFTRDKALKRFEVRVQFLPSFSIHNGSPLMSKAHLLLIMQRAFECRLLVWSSTLITYLLWNGIHFGEAVIWVLHVRNESQLKGISFSALHDCSWARHGLGKAGKSWSAPPAENLAGITQPDAKEHEQQAQDEAIKCLVPFRLATFY